MINNSCIGFLPLRLERHPYVPQMFEDTLAFLDSKVLVSYDKERPKISIRLLLWQFVDEHKAFENSRFSSLRAAWDVSLGETAIFAG